MAKQYRPTFNEALAKAKGMDQSYLLTLKEKFIMGVKAGVTNRNTFTDLNNKSQYIMTSSEFDDLIYVFVTFVDDPNYKVTKTDFGTIEGTKVYSFSSMLPREQYDMYWYDKFGSEPDGNNSTKSIVKVYGKVLTKEQEDLLKGIIDTVSGGDPEKLVANLEAFGYTPTKEQLTAALKAEVRRQVLEEIKAEEEAKAKAEA